MTKEGSRATNPSNSQKVVNFKSQVISGTRATQLPHDPPLVHYRAKYKKELKYFNDSSSLNSLFFLITSNADHIGVYGFLNKLRQLTAKARDEEKKFSHTARLIFHGNLSVVFDFSVENPFKPSTND